VSRRGYIRPLYQTLPSLDAGGRHSPLGTALAARNRLGGLHRAAFWRSLGFPNLVRARAAKAKKREQRLKLERIQAAKRFSPFALMMNCRLTTIYPWSIL
jgi:hypothetical protein